MTLAAFARDAAAKFHHRGCLINPEYPNVAADLREVANTVLAQIREGEAARYQELAAGYGLGQIGADKPFAFAGGVALIPIHGILLNKMSWGSSYATGYDYIRRLYQAAVADPDVEAIVYDVNSPGGMAAGCAELAAELATRQKPSLAVIDASAYSAAYWLATAADHIAVTPSGGVGSIGVVAMHVDFSQALEQDGIKVSFIQAGAEKTDGNPYEPLSTRARASIQRSVDSLYGLFTGAVADYRGLPDDDVRATEARTYQPDEAQELGLADSVATPAAALAQFLDRRSTMPQPADNAAGATTVTSATVAEAVRDALHADRQRAAAIRTSTEAAGRTALADHLASNTDLAVDVARSILAAAPKEPAPANPNGFVAAMESSANPNVGADNGGNGGGAAHGTETAVTKANRILANFGRVTGTKVQVIDHEAAAA